VAVAQARNEVSGNDRKQAAALARAQRGNGVAQRAQGWMIARSPAAPVSSTKRPGPPSCCHHGARRADNPNRGPSPNIYLGIIHEGCTVKLWGQRAQGACAGPTCARSGLSAAPCAESSAGESHAWARAQVTQQQKPTRLRDVGVDTWETQALSAKGFKRVGTRKALRIPHIHGIKVRKKRPRGFKKEAQGVQVSPLNPLSVAPWRETSTG
jgi:hypothetical protein